MTTTPAFGATSPVDHPRRWATYLPALPALSDADGTLDWSELDRRAQRTAVHLVEDRGLRRGDRVALLAANDAFFFELLYACVRAGLVLAPLNWRLATGELDGLLDLCEPAALFVDEANRDRAAQLRPPAGCQPIAVADHLASPPPARPSRAPLRGTGMEEPALLLFTSGTTGRPKAAVLPARQLFWNAVNTQLAFALTRADSTLLYTPLFHTGAINVLALPLHQVGGHVHVHASFDPAAVAHTVATAGVTTIFGVPTTLQALADEPTWFAAAAGRVRLCLCGGAPLSVPLVRRYRANGIDLTQGFGMTEAGPNCFFLPPTAVHERAGSVGKPMPYGEARLVVCTDDATGQRDAAPGEVGELWLRGPHVCAGYFRDPAATGAAFSDGWFRSGDLLQRDEDGFFSVAGRRKEMFISGGENVYPAEVELALYAHPAVSECAVVPIPDERWGEVGCAFVVARREADAGADADADAVVDEAHLRAFLRGRLAGYKVPKRIELRAALPRLDSGKIAKVALADEIRAASAGGGAPSPRGEEEARHDAA